MKTKSDRMTREIHSMPAHVRQTLKDEGLWDAYKERPSYQQNDYVGWVKQASRFLFLRLLALNIYLT